MLPGRGTSGIGKSFLFDICERSRAVSRMLHLCGRLRAGRTTTTFNDEVEHRLRLPRTRFFVKTIDLAAVAEAAGMTGRRTRGRVLCRSAKLGSSAARCIDPRALKLLRNLDEEPLDLRDVPLPLDPMDDRCVNDGHVGLPIGRCVKQTRE
jgi:hypothetical protein